MEEKQRETRMFSKFFKCKPRTVPCTYTEFQKPSVKIIMEEKQRETRMFSSFFKREPRTNSTLHIHRISKAISENKHRG